MCDDASEDAREEDADKEAGEDGRDGLGAAVRRCEVGGERDEDLGRDGGEAVEEGERGEGGEGAR